MRKHVLNNGKAALRVRPQSIIDLFGISFNHCASPVRLQCVCLLHVAISKGLSLIFVMIKTQHHIATATLRLTRAYSTLSPTLFWFQVPVSSQSYGNYNVLCQFARLNLFVMRPRLIVFSCSSVYFVFSLCLHTIIP